MISAHGHEQLSACRCCAHLSMANCRIRLNTLVFEVLIPGMRDFVILFVIVTVARLAGPGGLGSVVAESALVHQLPLW